MKGKTAGENIDDSTIHTKATSKLVNDTDTRCLKIEVAVTKRDVVLIGFLKNRGKEKRLIGKIREIRG
jgi:osmotically-inducible protein OsmY